MIKQSEECLQFVEMERDRPTKVNKMSFYPNTFPKMILEVDRVSFFESLSLFKPSANWRNLYVNLFKTVDFYENSYEEIFSKYQIHLDKKVAMSMDIASKIDQFVDAISTTRNNMIQNLPNESISTNPFYELLHSTSIKFQNIISARNQMSFKDQFENNDPAAMSVWSGQILQPFFDGTLILWREHGADSFNFNETLLPLTQNLIRQIDILTRDSLDYANHIEEYANKYLVKDAPYVQKLETTSNELNSSLNQSNLIQ